MKLLLFSDLHCNVHMAHSLVAQAREADIVIGAGDFATMRRGMTPLFDILKAIECPAILVPGNNESLAELVAVSQIWPTAHVLHGSGMTIDGVAFYGLGGGVPVTPFGSWSHDFTEAEAEALLAGCPSNGVLISHSPPKGVVDLSSRGQSLGSRAVLKTIEQKQPLLVVCGHIHESAGKWATVGQTQVVNAGPKGILYQLELTTGRNHVP